MKQYTSVDASKESILAALPDLESGQVSFRAVYEPGCWRNVVQMMYILGEAMFIAQHCSIHKDGQGNFDYILLPIDTMNDTGYALRKRVDEIALPENFISFGGISAAKNTENAAKFVEDEEAYLQEANEAHFCAIRVGIYKAWKLHRAMVGWDCSNPREDVYPFTNNFNAGQQIKHPAELAMGLLQGGLVKIYGNFASQYTKHPREHIIKGYRQALWRAYYPNEKFPALKHEIDTNQS